ncbi:ATP-dependent endonuclease, partial [Planctomycetota bacterium]
DASSIDTIVLMLAPKDDAHAYIFFNSTNEPLPLTEDQLNNVRDLLPHVEIINSEIALNDQLPLACLLEDEQLSIYPHKVMNDISKTMKGVTLPQIGKALTEAIVKDINTVKEMLDKKAIEPIYGDAELEKKLFEVILDIHKTTRKYISELENKDRGYIEGQTAEWNKAIEDKLNLSRYWQQDESFSLTIDYKDGMLYFDIHDKTGSKYTFSERSSGLKYFLSYYIQSKAIQMSILNKNSIILMDEPDSFLSVLGQRNLLSIFESLVENDSEDGCQLIYTTHSPFLINKNFPRRICLVRKGDGEEGTQHIRSAYKKRYEPIRSALGVDCAQTLFMGESNILVEGAVDQYFIGEFIRYFSKPDNIFQLLDLNTVTLVNAGCASYIDRVLAVSQWGDEKKPDTVVIVDWDKGGRDAWKTITGNGKTKKRIDEKYVITIKNLLDGDEDKDYSIEDLIPWEIYKTAVVNYAAKWYKESFANKGKGKSDDFLSEYDGTTSTVDYVNKFFRSFIFDQDDSDRKYDKMGVAEEVINELRRQDRDGEALAPLKQTVLKLCSTVRVKLDDACYEGRKWSMKQNVKRIIKDFWHSQTKNITPNSVIRLMERLEDETKDIGDDSTNLLTAVSIISHKAGELQKGGREKFPFKELKKLLDKISANPISPKIDESKNEKQVVEEPQSESVKS